MFFNNKSVVAKIVAGYVAILILGLFTGVLGVYVLNQSQSMDESISDNNIPSLLLVKDFNTVALEFHKLINNWINQPNTNDKNRIRELHFKVYPELRDRWNSLKNEGQKTTFINQFDTLLTYQAKVMSLLKSDDDYSDDEAVDKSLEIYNKFINPIQSRLLENLEIERKKQTEDLETKQSAKSFYASLMKWVFLGSILIFSIIAIFASIVSLGKISTPLSKLTELAEELATGSVPEITDMEQNDEIGKMSKAIKKVANGLAQKTVFAENIGLGKYEYEFELQSENDVLGKSLLTMRDNLKKNAEEERRRSWSAQGLAQLNDIQRNLNQSEEELYDNVLKFIVNYTKANQGGLFVVTDIDKKDDVDLEMVACYAYSRKKFLNKKIKRGEGLAGQVYLEGELTYLTEVPDDYLSIRSGLGDASPRSVLIVPLIHNDEVLGVLEVASFHKYQDFEIQFVQKSADLIASTISSSKVSNKTKKLLEESQDFTQQMRNQEEEIRQNLEELMATQEEANRKIQQYETLLSEKDQIIDQLKSKIG